MIDGKVLTCHARGGETKLGARPHRGAIERQRPLDCLREIGEGRGAAPGHAVVDDLRDRPYEIVFVAGGWQHRTRSRFAVPIRASQASTRSATPATTTTDVFFKCTKGSSPAFTVGTATASPYNGTLVGSGTAASNSMTYTISWTAPTAGSGAGFNVNAQSLTLSGSIPVAQFQAAAAGPYAENVTISLAP